MAADDEVASEKCVLPTTRVILLPVAALVEFEPISPQTFVVPVLSIAPDVVNNAKPVDAPNVGACPKVIFGKMNKKSKVKIKTDLFFILIDRAFNKPSGNKGHPLLKSYCYTTMNTCYNIYVLHFESRFNAKPI